MKRKLLTGGPRSYIVLASVFVVSCTPVFEEKMLQFPIMEISNTSEPERIIAEKVATDIVDLTGFAVLENKLISTSRFGADHCLDVIDLKSGETLHQLCRAGRGPGEFLNLSPLFSITEEAAVVYDSMRGMVSEVCVDGENVGDIIHQVKLEVPSGEGVPIIMTCYKVNEENLVAYNSIQAPFEEVSIENPYYAVYDYETGFEKRAFHLFDATPLSRTSEGVTMTAFDLRDCINYENNQVCFTMGKMPVFGFLDISSGEVRGFRLKGEQPFSTKENRIYFTGVCARGQFIYALYVGKSRSELTPEACTTMLYKLDWAGHILNRFELDGFYRGCCAASDRIFLSKMEDAQTVALYQLDINKL